MFCEGLYRVACNKKIAKYSGVKKIEIYLSLTSRLRCRQEDQERKTALLHKVI